MSSEATRRMWCALVLVTFTIFHAGAAMRPMPGPKLEQFKQRIDFDRIVAAEPAGLAVQAVWPDPLRGPGIANTQWKIDGDTTWRVAGGAAREWVLRRGGEMLGVLVFISAGGSWEAREFFLARASNNMMPEVPYTKGPAGLGTLAVHTVHPGAASVIWLFHTAVFHVYSRDSPIDVSPIVQWLQSFAAAGVVAAGSIQVGPATLRMSAQRAAVGQPIDVVYNVAPGTERQYQVDVAFDRGAVALEALRGLYAQVKGLRPGVALVDVQLIDRRTLLSVISRVDIEFVGPGGTGP